MLEFTVRVGFVEMHVCMSIVNMAAHFLVFLVSINVPGNLLSTSIVVKLVYVG